MIHTIIALTALFIYPITMVIHAWWESRHPMNINGLYTIKYWEGNGYQTASGYVTQQGPRIYMRKHRQPRPQLLCYQDQIISYYHHDR